MLLVYSLAAAGYFTLVLLTTGNMIGAIVLAGVCLLSGLVVAGLCRKGVDK